MLLKKGLIIPIVAKHPEGNKHVFNAGNIVVNFQVEPSMRIVRKEDSINTGMGYSRLHLYLFVKEDAHKGDFVINEDADDSIIQVEDFVQDALRLVATTNTKFPIARLPKLFLNQYVEEGGIDSTMVVYEERGEHLFPSINSRNMIKLSGLKDCYTGEEVSNMIDALLEQLSLTDEAKSLVRKWKEENI